MMIPILDVQTFSLFVMFIDSSGTKAYGLNLIKYDALILIDSET